MKWSRLILSRLTHSLGIPSLAFQRPNLLLRFLAGCLLVRLTHHVKCEDIMLNIPALLKRDNFLHCLRPVSALMALTASVSMAHAGVIQCTAKITEVMVAPSGAVLINFSGVGTPYMCNLNVTITGVGVGAISPAVCQSWVAMFITAKSTQSNFTMVIDYGAASAPTTCVNLPNFSYTTPDPFPYWVDLGG
jgi:hypothetical protein